MDSQEDRTSDSLDETTEDAQRSLNKVTGSYVLINETDSFIPLIFDGGPL